VASDHRFVVLTLLNVGFATASGVLVLALPYESVHYLRLPAWLPGLALGFHTLLLSMLAGRVARLLRGRRRDRVLVTAAVVYGIGGLGLVLTERVSSRPALVVMLAFGVAALTCAELVATPVLSVLSAFSGPDHLRGRYVALFQMSWSLANGAGAAGVSALLEQGPGLAWCGLTALATATAAGTGLLGRRSKDHLLTERIGTAPPVDASASP
jgi:hypothetical protein